jgi:hypothetical protein
MLAHIGTVSLLKQIFPLLLLEFYFIGNTSFRRFGECQRKLETSKVIHQFLGTSAHINITLFNMSDNEKQMQDAANNLHGSADANKSKEACQNLEPARNVIHEEYGQTQACVEETKR